MKIKEASSEDEEEDLLDNYNTEDVDAHDYSNVDHVIFACDAGMGSSAMGASMLRNKFKKQAFQTLMLQILLLTNYQIMHNLLLHKNINRPCNQTSSKRNSYFSG